MDATTVLELGAFVSCEAMLDTDVSTEYGLAAVLVHEPRGAHGCLWALSRVQERLQGRRQLDSVMLFDDSHLRRVNGWPTVGRVHRRMFCTSVEMVLAVALRLSCSFSPFQKQKA